MITTKEILIEAKKVKTLLASLSTEEKNSALLKMADALIENADEILTANKSDLERAKGTISDVIQNSAQDLYEVKTEEGKKVYIPVVKQFVLDVDMDSRIVKVELPEGLLDL